MRIGLLLFSVVLVFSANLHAQEKNNTLTLEINNIESFDSKLYVGIYNSEKDFKNKSNAVDSAVLVPSSKGLKLKFNIPAHKYYAAAGFQDLNNNGKLDTGVFGIPVEPVCVSEYDHKPKAPPTFKKSEFYFVNDTTIVMPLVSGKKEIEKLEKEF